MPDFTIGTDPEFVFVRNNKPLLVSDFLPHNTQDELGADGHPWIAEMRPPPGKNPSELVDNIRKILDRYKNHFDTHGIPSNQVSWQAGSFVATKSIGGHIHFGHPDLLRPTGEMVEILDGVLALVTLMMEDADGARRRRSSTYGQLSDIRGKPYGFEYRTPASWMVSAPISVGVLALAKAIVFEELDGGPMRIKNLPNNVLKLITIQEEDKKKFMRGEKEYFRERFPDMWKGLIRNYSYWFTEEGKAYWKNIALLRHVIMNYPDWHNDRDILHRWGVRDFTPKSYIRPMGPTPINNPEEVRGVRAENLLRDIRGFRYNP